MGTLISFKRPDGNDARGYLANAGRGDAPGVVVIQEWWGLSEQIKGLTDRFALAGFDALAPDFYNGTVVPYHDTDAANREMSSLDFIDATTQTVRGAVQYLGRNSAKVGLTGSVSAAPSPSSGPAKYRNWARRWRSTAFRPSRLRRQPMSACRCRRISQPATIGARRNLSMHSRRA
jgi:hypothetical protein